MKSDYDVAARKRPVNLTLNEDLVNQVKGLTDNPLEMVSTPVDQLGALVGSLSEQSQLIVAALDELFTRAWK